MKYTNENKNIINIENFHGNIKYIKIFFNRGKYILISNKNNDYKYQIKLKYNYLIYNRSFNIYNLDDTILKELTNNINDYINYPQTIKLDIIESFENINIDPNITEYKDYFDKELNNKNIYNKDEPNIPREIIIYCSDLRNNKLIIAKKMKCKFFDYNRFLEIENSLIEVRRKNKKKSKKNKYINKKQNNNMSKKLINNNNFNINNLYNNDNEQYIIESFYLKIRFNKKGASCIPIIIDEILGGAQYSFNVPKKIYDFNMNNII